MSGQPAPVSDIRVRRTFAKLAAFEPLAPHELALFDHVVEEVVAQIRRMRGDAPLDQAKQSDVSDDALGGFIDIG